MSSVTISGDTSGSIILQAPSVAGSTTLTLPTTSGTLSLTASPTFTGQATIPTINLTSGQITFPAVQNPSADANTLDDYEEGTFTPTVIPGTSGSVTYSTQTGRYTKIGNMVYIQLYLFFSKNTASGNFRIGNLPFASSSDSALYGPAVNCYYSNFATAVIGLTGYVAPGATSFYVQGNTAAATNTDTIIQFSNLNSSCDLIWLLVYRTS